ncbi:MAG: DUF4129 domain-containing protein, partial [Nocardia sp.]|nr:DUF4129 domain-containing protein [Nocardia sp.]
VLDVRRSRTARETARAAAATLPGTQGEFDSAARSFDEIVYGGRPATDAEYLRLTAADRYSLAPPPAPDPVEVPARSRRSGRPRLPPAPKWLRDRRLWVAILIALGLGLIIFLLLKLSAAPTAPPPPPSHRTMPPPERPDLPPPDFGSGDDSIFHRLPGPVVYGGLQALILAAIVVWWRAARRGTIVREPRPVEVEAGELLRGQAALYRRTGDHEHLAATLRSATLRRIRTRVNLRADTPPEQVTTTIAARVGVHPTRIAEVLYTAVPDDRTLEYIAAQLDWIESEIG